MITGEIDTAKFTGYTARLFQHEYDHIKAVDFRQESYTLSYGKSEEKYEING